MISRPRVSVALATFDGVPYLAEQLRSILDQTVPVDEIIVSDDGSADGTPELAERLLSGSAPRVRILRNPAPLGPSRNFERALRETTGDLLILSDQDDIWHRERVERARDVLTAPGGPWLVHSDARRVDAVGSPLPHGLLRALRVTPGEYREIARGDAFRSLLRRNLVTGATAAFRRELLDVAMPFPAAWMHDEWLAVLAAASGGVALLREPLVDYRQHERNEIGAGDITLGVRAGRLRVPRAERNARLLSRAEKLRDRLLILDPDLVRSDALPLAEQKLLHEIARTAYPAARIPRILPVLRELVTGRYSRFGRARFDVLRDLAQPAGEETP